MGQQVPVGAGPVGVQARASARAKEACTCPSRARALRPARKTFTGFDAVDGGDGSDGGWSRGGASGEDQAGGFPPGEGLGRDSEEREGGSLKEGTVNSKRMWRPFLGTPKKPGKRKEVPSDFTKEKSGRRRH